MTDLSPLLWHVNHRVEQGILTEEDAAPLRARIEAGEAVSFMEMVSDTPAGRAYVAQVNEDRRQTNQALRRLAATRPAVVRAADRGTARQVHRWVHESKPRGTSRERAPRSTARSSSRSTRRASSASSSRTGPRQSADDGGSEPPPEPPARLAAPEPVHWYRERIALALDELGIGDQRAAVNTLLYALDGPEIPKTYTCDACGSRFEWPGLLDKHQAVDCPALWARWAA